LPGPRRKQAFRFSLTQNFPRAEEEGQHTCWIQDTRKEQAIKVRKDISPNLQILHINARIVDCKPEVGNGTCKLVSV
jgi:hypothetical protein